MVGLRLSTLSGREQKRGWARHGMAGRGTASYRKVCLNRNSANAVNIIGPGRGVAGLGRAGLGEARQGKVCLRNAIRLTL